MKLLKYLIVSTVSGLLFVSASATELTQFGGIELGITNKSQLIEILRKNNCQYKTYKTRESNPNEGFSLTENCFNPPFESHTSIVMDDDEDVVSAIFFSFKSDELKQSAINALRKRYGRPELTDDKVTIWKFNDQSISVSVWDEKEDKKLIMYKLERTPRAIKAQKWFEKNL